MNPILEPLTFPDKNVPDEMISSQCECLFCSEVFDLKSSNDQILAHFLLTHKLVIADVKEIVDLKRYLMQFIKKFCLKVFSYKTPYILKFSDMWITGDQSLESQIPNHIALLWKQRMKMVQKKNISC